MSSYSHCQNVQPLSNVKLGNKFKMYNSQVSLTINCCQINYFTKTKKCQPAASDTPDLIQTECVADSGLARYKKISERKNKIKKEINRMENGLIAAHKLSQLKVQKILSRNKQRLKVANEMLDDINNSENLSKYKIKGGGAAANVMENDTKPPNKVDVDCFVEKNTSYLSYLTSKERNKLKHSENGNKGKSMNIAHWNIGSSHWAKKGWKLKL